MDATEPNPSESSPPRSGDEMASEPHREWECPVNGCFVCMPPLGVVVSMEEKAELDCLRADAEALAHAVSMSLDTEVRELAPVRIQAQARLAKALNEYLAKHPWSDL